MPNTSFEGAVNALRTSIKGLGSSLLAVKDNLASSETMQNENRGEVLANLMLTYRHLEDASMRLGKVLQHRDGGVSVYDKESTIGPTGGTTTSGDDHA